MAKIYYSGHIFSVARKSYQKSLDDKEESLATIILSSIAFEAFLAEFQDILLSPVTGNLSKKLIVLQAILKNLEDEKASVSLKVQTIFTILNEKPLDKGIPPFQDYFFLIKIRNFLIHKKPEKVELGFTNSAKTYTPHKFVKYLSDRKIIPKSNTANATNCYNNIVVPSVGKWTFNIYIKIIKLILKAISNRRLKKMTQFLTQRLKEIK